MQPEKFYEACITYNIIMAFKRIGKTVYPYSISQRKEKREGFDFGYIYDEASFLIQFKRPEVVKELKVGEEIYSWKIEREQLETLNKNRKNVPIYYALPAFEDVYEWYLGIKKTYFIDSKRLEEFFEKDKKTKVLRSDCPALKRWDDIFESFRRENYDYAIEKIEEVSVLSWEIDEEMEGLWAYCVKEM